MRLHVIQHVEFEGPAGIADWARERGHDLAVTRPDAGQPLPGPDGYDWLVVMGGPMSANDPLPWLAAEKRLIEGALESGKLVLGVCLGAQLLASALGAPVYRAVEKEIGWLPVRRSPGAGGSAFFEGLPERFTAYHWHGEMFDLPAGAVRLAETETCPNQAFEYGGRALGLQFHLEATEASVRGMTAHCGADIGGGAFEQPAGEHLGRTDRFDEIGRTLRYVLNRMAEAGGRLD